MSGPAETSWPAARIPTKADAHSSSVTPAAATASGSAETGVATGAARGRVSVDMPGP